MNVRRDISILEGQIEEDKTLIKKYSVLIEHLEILCQNGESKDTKYLDVKPKNAVDWNKKSIQDIEKEYGDLINPKPQNQ